MSLDQVYAKLEKLRTFDSLIDFSKSRIQLDIVLQLASSRQPLSADELAAALNVRKKPILDALRKLELKGIIKRVDNYRNVYELTELGKQMVEDLMAILGFSDFKEAMSRSKRYGKVEARDLIKLIIPVHYLYEALVALGTAKNNELPLEELARAAGISAQRLSMYLEPYTDSNSEVRLFKKVRRESLLTKVRNVLLRSKKFDTYYKLTNLGLESYYRLPVYPKIKNSKLLKLVTGLFRNYNPKLVIYRYAMIDVMFTSMLLTLSVLLPLPLVLAPLLASKVILASLVFMAYSR